MRLFRERVLRDGLALALLAIMLLSFTLSMEKAEWVKPLPFLSGGALAALLLGFVLARAAGPAAFLLPLGLALGAAGVLWQVTSVLPEARFIDQLGEVGLRSRLWLETARSGGISNDPLPFILVLTTLAWLLGYFCAWLVFHWQRGFWAVFPGAMALLVNLFYAPARLAPLFFLYLFSALMLEAHLSFVRLEQGWQENRVSRPASLKPAYYGLLLFVCLGLVAFSWSLPLAQGWLKGTLLPQTGLWRTVDQEFSRLFPMLASERASRLYTFGTTLPFRGKISLGSGPVMRVSAYPPGYWRANIYEVYTPQGWLSAERLVQEQAATLESALASHPSGDKVIQRVELFQPTDFFVLTGQPLAVDRPTLVELTGLPTFTVSVEPDPRDASLPPALGPWVERLRNSLSQGRFTAASAPIMGAPPPGFRIARVERRGDRVISLKLQQMKATSTGIATLRSPQPLAKGEEYTVVSLVSTATPDQLRSQSTEYPEWIRQHFLPLPPELPQRVRSLARQLTQGAGNPYDKTVAIESYLRTLNYSLDISAPPPGRDAVEYFLFTSRTGYCDYFASAMVVLLRSQGIPTRIAAGFYTGEYDIGTASYIVRESDAHSWPEVFFPDSGWVAFEPTPARPLIEREPQPIVSPVEEEEDMFGEEELDGGAPLGSISVPRTVGLALFILALVFLFPFIYRAVRNLRGRSLSQLGYEARLYEKMARLASLVRVGPQSSLTPHEFARQLSLALPSGSQAIEVIVSGYARATYGRKMLRDRERLEMEAAWSSLRGKLLMLAWHRGWGTARGFLASPLARRSRPG